MSKEFQQLRKRWLADPKSVDVDAIGNPEYRISLSLIKARLKAGLTQKEAAGRMGMSVRTVSRLESGNIPIISYYAAIAKIIGKRL
ncbi:MAG: helix-turn-helix transcriptional regulator [Magnetococcales bacterium]|nr:helix-turn-helix transcriptional regulator [Magnetococcales bacterium]